jgi:hypothetical protein
MTGKDVIKYIQDNHLEDAKVTVTATMYYDGDHDCRTTDNVSISKANQYIGKGKSIPTVDFYVDSELY